MPGDSGGEPPDDRPPDAPPVPESTAPDPADDPDCVITTVVAASDTPSSSDALDTMPPMDLGEHAPSVADVPEDLLWVVGELNTGRQAAQVQAEQLARVEGRLATLEAVPAGLDALSRATRTELERCAGVLFGHDRVLNETRERLDALSGRLGPFDPATITAAPGATDGEAPGRALARVVEQLDALGRRLAVVEARVEPLEAVPTVVQALRRAVRDSEDHLAGEATAREAQVAALASDVGTQAQARDDAMRRLLAQDLDRMAGFATSQAQSLEDIGRRLAAAEARLAPLDSAPADIEALSRILRRELDAATTDTQARDQMLRRALQQEIDRLNAASEAREQLAGEAAARLGVVESRLGEETVRLDAADARLATADGLAPQIEELRELVHTELEQLRADAKAHDQVIGEITRRSSALDGRLARVDPLPGELQSLRTALRQEAERSVTQLRGVEERLAQLAWVPGEFQEARKRILAVTSGLQVGQDAIRALESSLASTNERVKALVARIGAGVVPEPPA